MEASAECLRLRPKPPTAICGSAPRLGLFRFDGVRFVAWNPPGGQHLLDPRIFSLLAARDGSLWIGTGFSVSHWAHGRLINYPQISGRIEALAEDAKGAMWLAAHKLPTAMGPICRIDELA